MCARACVYEFEDLLFPTLSDKLLDYLKVTSWNQTLTPFTHPDHPPAEEKPTIQRPAPKAGL